MPRKDKTGCIVFFDQIAHDYGLNLNPQLWVDLGHCLGLVVAHELGHAIGHPGHVTVQNGPDVMSNFPFGGFSASTGPGYAEYSHFDERYLIFRTPDTQDYWYTGGVCLRQVLGVHTTISGGLERGTVDWGE